MRSYAVAGAEGVGTTTTALNLAVALRAGGYHAAVLDARGDVAETLGRSPGMTLADVLAGQAPLRDAIAEHSLSTAGIPAGTAGHDHEDSTGVRADGTAPDRPTGDTLPVVAGWVYHQTDDSIDVDPRAVGDVLDDLAMAYDHVVVDTHEAVGALESVADSLLVVTTPEDDHLEVARTLVRDNRERVAGVVLNRVGEVFSVQSLADRTGADVLGVVPADERTRDLEPVAYTMADGSVGAAYERLAENVAAWDGTSAARIDPEDVDDDDEDDGLLGRLTRRF